MGLFLIACIASVIFWLFNVGVITPGSPDGTGTETTQTNTTQPGTAESNTTQTGTVGTTDRPVDSMFPVAFETADLDHDGGKETFQVQEIEIGAVYQLDVLKQNGSTLWWEQTKLSADGWDSVFLYTEDGEDYLLQYSRTVEQEEAEYRYELYWIENGSKAVVSSGNLRFSTREDRLAAADQRYHRAKFAEQINSLLSKSRVLLSTGDSQLTYGGSAADDFLEDFEEFGGVNAENLVMLSTGYVVDTSKPIVALTFDDGPSQKTTPQILAALKENGCHATFFMVGYQLKLTGSEEILKTMIANGCELANHTMDHPELTKLDKPGQLAQVEQVAKMIEDMVGIRPALVRPPYGSVNQSVFDNVPYPLINWSVDPEDWKAANKDPQIIFDNVMNTVKDNSIVLMHDIHETTVGAVELLLPALKEEGYQVVTVSEMFEARGIALEPGKTYRYAN